MSNYINNVKQNYLSMNIALYVDIIININCQIKNGKNFALLTSMKYVFLIGFLRKIF